MSAAVEEGRPLVPGDNTQANAPGSDEEVGCTGYARGGGILSRFKFGSRGGYSSLSSRVSIHDPWELNADDGDDTDDENGAFVSFWGRGDGDSSGGGDSETKVDSQRHRGDEESDDRVETTMRPIPICYRNSDGTGTMPCIIHDSNSMTPRVDSALSFQREHGVAHAHFRERERRELAAGSGVEDFYGGDHEEEAAMRRSDRAWISRKGEGLLAWPMIRPFIRGSRRGFADDIDEPPLDAMEVEECDDDMRACDGDVPSRRDRVAVVKSISRGISASQDDSLLLDPAAENGDGASTARPPHLLKRIFVMPFWPASDGNGEDRSPIGQLHQHFRKENWALATTLLQSNPELAKTWFNIDCLYDGRYDGVALPIHAACALRPPPSFVEMLAALHPGGLREKDEKFGRAPLHVACRSLASFGVIRKLCEMESAGAEERDNLKRVPLHYLIKNYSTFGKDNDDIDIDGDMPSADEVKHGEEGMHAMRVLIRTSPECVRAADHRNWLPLHVACSCSSRAGMLRAIRLLLKVAPESVRAKTERGSDPIACVDMAGKHHPTKDAVISLLKEALLEENSKAAHIRRESEECNKVAAEYDKSEQSLSEQTSEEIS